METYTITLTERQMFLLMEGTIKLTDSIWNDVPRVLSSGLSDAVKELDAEIDELCHLLANAKPDR